MRPPRNRSIAAWGLLLLVSLPVGAVRADEIAHSLAACQDQSSAARKRIAACQRVIDDKSIENDMRVEAMLNLGMAQEDQDDDMAALESYTRIIALEPTSSLAHFNRANVLDRIGQVERALSDYDKAIELDPSDPEFFHNRGLLLLDRGDAERALADFNQAIKLGLADASIHAARGEAHEKLGRKAAARDDYRKALSIDPTNEDAKEALQRLR